MDGFRCGKVGSNRQACIKVIMGIKAEIPSGLQFVQVFTDLMQCVCVLFVEERRLLLES